MHNFLELGDLVAKGDETIYFHIREDCLAWREVLPNEVGQEIDELSYGFFRRAIAEPAAELEFAVLGKPLDPRKAWWELHDQLANYNGAGLEFMVQKEPGEPPRLVLLRVAYARPQCFPPTVKMRELVEALGGVATIIEMLEAGRP